MPPDPTLLSAKYSLTQLSVHNATQISTRTTAVAGQLGASPATTTTTTSGDAGEATKPPLVVLTARSKAANKLISIVEIVKREVASPERPVYQYNALSHEVVEIPRQRGRGGGGGGSVVEGDDEEEGFETMRADQGGGMKKRAVPVLTVYLSSCAVKELRLAYGEQRAP